MICGSRAGHYVIVNPTGGGDVAEIAPNIKFVGEVSLGYMSKKAIMASPIIQGANPVIFVCDATTGANLTQLVSEDDFSADGKIGYKNPAINGQETNLEDINSNLSQLAKAIENASKKRDEIKEQFK